MKNILGVLAAAALLAPAAARAESEFSVSLEGGGTKFNQSLSGSDLGVNYGARLGFLPTPMLGVELGYTGSQNNFRQTLATGTSQSSFHTNELYGDVRLNLLPGQVTPYVFGGYGRTWVNTDAVGFNTGSANTLPFGGGVDFNVGAFKIGGRFQYNYLFNKIYTGSNSGGASASVDKGGNSDFYGASVNLGASFH